jgi:hypothetical protein
VTVAKPNDYRQRLLSKLQAAGSAGLTRTGLGIKSATRTGRSLMDVLTELEREGRIRNLGVRGRPRYVLQEYYRPLELAYEHVQGRAVPGKPVLYTKNELAKGLKAPLREKLDEALDLLVKENAVLRLRRATVTLYLHAASLPAPPSKSARPGGPDKDTLLEAYRRAVQASGFSDVLVEEVQQHLDTPIEALKALLVQECRAGRAVPSVGDWSLSSERARAAAITINGRPHLRIRLLD